MRRLAMFALLGAAAITTPDSSQAQSAAAPATAAATSLSTNDAAIEALLARMTVEEKVGQLSLFAPAATAPLGNPVGNPASPAQNTASATPSAAEAQQLADIRAGRVMGLFNGAGLAGKRRAQQVAVNESRLGIPLLFAADVIHGFRTVFPVPLAEAASWEPALAERTARAAAVEASADGFRWTFAPMVDIARDARWGRGVEGAGEDVFLARQFAAARVRGFQGDRPVARRRHAGHAQAFRGLWRSRRRARLRRRRALAAGAARGAPAAVSCRHRGRCTLAHDRLPHHRRPAGHGACRAVARRAARRMGLCRLHRV